MNADGRPTGHIKPHDPSTTGEQVEVSDDDDDPAASMTPEQIAQEEARLVQTEREKIAADKQAMMQDQVCTSASLSCHV